MRILRIVLAIVLVVIGVVSTVGSGGGGDGITTFGSTPPVSNPPFFPPPPIDYGTTDVTVANAQDVAATAVRAHDHALQLAAILGGQVFPGVPSAPGQLPGNSKFELLDAALTSGEPVTGVCVTSGIVTVSAAVYTGVANLVFDTCDDGDGYIIDGSFSLKVWELDGDPRTDVYLLHYILENMALTIASGTDSYAASVRTSSFGLGLDSRAYPTVVLSHSFAHLKIVTQEDMYSWLGGDNYLTLNTDLSPVTKLLQTDGSLMNSASLGGNFYYDTIIPLQTTDDQDPESGEILINGGTRNGTVRIVIESATSVRLEIDADGDNTVDDYQYTTWAALRG